MFLPVASSATCAPTGTQALRFQVHRVGMALCMPICLYPRGGSLRRDKKDKATRHKCAPAPNNKARDLRRRRQQQRCDGLLHAQNNLTIATGRALIKAIN
eukprot:GHVU01118235.1.p2 GENE.GHVU01118235.1~~GHVU01118235.1.p2  ORF type:complete len:100 (-),score=5.31 GHVU01118235.1:86-385(-)